MITIPAAIIAEVIIGFIIWWLAVYFITQNPFNRLTQLIFGILACLSVYLTSDLLIYTGYALKEFYVFGEVIKVCAFGLYLPFAFLYHVSYLLTEEKNRRVWQKAFIYVSYLFSFTAIYLESFTKLTRDYDFIDSGGFNGDYATATAKYFGIPGILLVLTIGLTTINFFKLMRDEKKYSNEWYKYFWPFIGMLFAVVSGPFIILGYYNIIPHSEVAPILLMMFTAFSLVYSILRYGLLIDDSKIIFNKTFLYSTIASLAIVIAFFVLMIATKLQLKDVPSYFFPYLLFYFLIASHPFYSWILTFVQDLAYNARSGLSVVTDDEVLFAIKNFNKPERLENSTLLRLKVVEDLVRRKKEDTAVDALKKTIKSSIEYFDPKEDKRRTKRFLKFQLLKMLAFDESEEGQILWELGFSEYPVKILSQENKHRKPLFEVSSPSDYSYTSRNAFIALKKEAIHNVAWRISYLEKLCRK